MASLINLAGIDMNDPKNLELYSQILTFKNDTVREDFVFRDQVSSSQRCLQTLAHSLGLEYEYSLPGRTVRISRSENTFAEKPPILEPTNVNGTPSQPAIFPRIEEFDFYEANMEGLVYDGFDENEEEFPADHARAELIASTDKDAFWSGGDPILNPEIASHDFLVGSSQLADTLVSIDVGLAVPLGISCENDIGQGHLDRCIDGEDILDPTTYSTISPRPCLNCEDTKAQCDWSVTCRNCLDLNIACDRTYLLPLPGADAAARRYLDKARTQTQSTTENSKAIKPPGSAASKFTGRKRHLCDKCPKTFFRKTHLKLHRICHRLEQTHSGEHSETFASYNISQHCQNKQRQRLPMATSGNFSLMDQARSPSIWPSTNLSLPDHNTGLFQGPSPTQRATSYSRATSVHSGASSGYQEIVFDSKSVNSVGSNASAASAASAASGRRGPLTDWARAKMNAVKKVGACWKCKFTRKICDSQNPCARCATSDKPLWTAVGCGRGAFQDIDVTLCPSSKLNGVRSPIVNRLDLLEVQVKIKSINTPDHVDAWFDQDIDLPLPDNQDNAIIRATAARRMHLHEISSACKAVDYQPISSELMPVREGVLAVVWELLHCELGYNVLDDNNKDDHGGSLQFAHLLSSAAVCQARNDGDQLIAQSLICLRICAQALRVKKEGLLDSRWHRFCTSPELCRIDCLSSINMHLQLYLQELNRVFFKKENMRKPQLWWLSALYSFCIQSMVRRALLSFSNDLHDLVDSLGWPRKSGAEWYLHRPLRLFFAVTANFDPLKLSSEPNPPIPLDGQLTKKDISVVRQAIEHTRWEENGITSTSIYLRRLFEIEDHQAIALELPREGAKHPANRDIFVKEPYIDGPSPNCERVSGRGFSCEEHLNEHLRRVHTKESDRRFGVEDETLRRHKKARSAFKCPAPACGKRFSKGEVVDHLCSHLSFPYDNSEEREDYRREYARRSRASNR